LTLDLQIATGERKAAEFLEIFYNEKIIKDSPERFRCEICSKMFKGPLFVKKHISVKHSEKLEEIREKAREEQFYRNYVTHCDKMIIVKEREEREKEKEKERKMQEERQREKERREKERKEKSQRDNKSPERKDKNRDVDRKFEKSVDREKRKSSSKSPSRADKARTPFDKNVDLRSGKPRSPKGSPSRFPSERDSPERRDRNGFRGGRGGFNDNFHNRGRGGFNNRFNYNRRNPLNMDEELPPPPEFRDKMDPRSKSLFVFKDLDKPQDDSFEIDYEKALAAFAEDDS